MRCLIAVPMLALFLVVVLDGRRADPPAAALAIKCVGADPCHACVNCRECQHCRNGGTCGACKPKPGERALAYFAEPMCR